MRCPQVNVLVSGVGLATNAPTVTVMAVRATAVAPASVASTGLTLLNITGRGFDNTTCSNNVVTVGGVVAGVVSCSTSLLRVLVNPAGASNAAADVVVKLLSGGSTIDQFTFASAVNIGSTTSSLLSTPSVVAGVTLPGSGFTVTGLFGSAAAAASITSAFLVPAIPITFTEADAPTQSPNLTVAFSNPRPCTSIAVDGGNSAQASCDAGTSQLRPRASAAPCSALCKRTAR